MNPKRRTTDPTAQTWPIVRVYGVRQETWFVRPHFPTEEDELDDWRCLSISNAAGELPRCDLQRELGRTNTHLQDRFLEKGSDWIVEVWLLDQQGKRVRPLFAGVIAEQSFALSKSGEYETATATVPPYWFGDLCEGQKVYDPHQDEDTIVHHDLEFNPMVDAKIVPNMRTDRGDIPMWIDPESARTHKARQLHGLPAGEADGEFQEAESWTLSDAIEAVCDLLNRVLRFEGESYEYEAVEEFVQNPLLSDFSGGSPDLKNIVIHRGQFLPSILNALLPPHGYNWWLKFVDGEQTEGNYYTQAARPVIKIIKRGDGRRVPLLLDPLGSGIVESQLESVDITYNIANIRNKWTVYSSLKEREVTVPLFKAWDATEDGAIQEDNQLSRIGRKFVANEGGDYTDLRAEIVEEEIPDFGREFIVKRRPMEEMLRWRDGDKKLHRAPIKLEWRTGGGGWENVDNIDGASWRPLPDEIGVWLTKPVPELLEEDVELRITGTIRADKRLSSTFDGTAHSVNSREVRGMLDLSQKFHDRSIEDDGDFASEASGDADEQVDGHDMDDYAEKIGEIEKSATVAANPRLAGLQLDLEPGQVITGISGRNISLNSLSKASGEERYPQVIGLRHVFAPECRTYPTIVPYNVAKKHDVEEAVT